RLPRVLHRGDQVEEHRGRFGAGGRLLREGEAAQPGTGFKEKLHAWLPERSVRDCEGLVRREIEGAGIEYPPGFDAHADQLARRRVESSGHQGHHVVSTIEYEVIAGGRPLTCADFLESADDMRG